MWPVCILFTVFKKRSRKKFNFPKIGFISCLVYFPPGLLIIFIGIFVIFIHCHKIPRCSFSVSRISCNSNCCFSMNTCFYIKILRISTGFLRNFFSFKSFFNFVIGLIWLFYSAFNIFNCFFILTIIIFRSFYFYIQNFRI